jgi:hypothetical protein
MILANQGEGIDHVVMKPTTKKEKKFFHITKINNNSDSQMIRLCPFNIHFLDLCFTHI